MTTDLHLSQLVYSTKPPSNNTSRLSWATSMFYFWHAGWPIPNDICPAKIQYGANTRWSGLLLGVGVHAHSRCDKLAGPLRSTFLLGLRRKHYPNGIYVYHQLFLYSERAVLETELVVLVHWAFYHYWWSIELWIWPDQGRFFEALAIYIPTCWSS